MLTPPFVVALHSSGLSGRQWGRLARALPGDATLITPDFLGYGDAPPVAHDADFDFHADVAHIVAKLPSDRPVHLVGHSYGALCALVIARELGDRIASLSLYEPVAFGVLHAARDVAGLANLAAVETDDFFRVETGGDEAWLRSFVDYWNGPGAWDALAETARETFRKTGRKQFQEVRSLMHDRTPAEAYRTLTMPTLLLAGSATPIASRRTSALLAEAIPRAKYLEIEGAGHMGPLSHAAAVNARFAEQIAAATAK